MSNKKEIKAVVTLGALGAIAMAALYANKQGRKHGIREITKPKDK